MAKQKILRVAGPGFLVRFFFVSSEISNRIISVGEVEGLDVAIEDVPNDAVFPAGNHQADIFLM